MQSIFVCFLTFLLANNVVRAGMDDFPEDLSKWVRMKPDGMADGYWLDANNDTEHKWTVFHRDGHPSARLSEEWPPADPKLPSTIESGTAKEGLAGRRFHAKVSDGWIVGFNKGEWGGALWWFSTDGKKRAKISEDQVVGFIETDSGLLALEGIAHGGTCRGQIIRLLKGKDNLWHSEPFIDLAGAPWAAVKESKKTLLVTTYDRLLRVHIDSKKAEVIVKDAFWDLLYPGSMICTTSGTIYVGMRHGVAEIKKAGTAYEVGWLVPDAEYEKAFVNWPKGLR